VSAAASPRTLDLGRHPVGDESDPGTVTLTNNGTAPITFGTAAFAGDQSPDFQIATNGCSGQTLDVTQQCSITVVAVPSAASYRTARLEIADGSARGLRRVSLQAFGQIPPAAPVGVSAVTAGDGVSVSWAAPADDGGSTVSSYHVIRGTSADDLTQIGSVTGRQYGDRLSATTQAGTSYVYAVRAVNAAGSGQPSSSVAGVTPSSARVPTSDRVLSVDGVEGGALPSGSMLYTSPGTPFDISSRPDLVEVSTPATGSVPGSRVVLGMTSGARLVPGKYPAGAPGAPATNYSGDGLACSGSTGDVTIHEVVFDADDRLMVLDADISVPCGTDTASRVTASLRIGTARDYSNIVAPNVDLGPSPVGQSTSGRSTFTNQGTAAVTVSGVQLSAANGGSAADWAIAGGTCVTATLVPGGSCYTDVTATPSAQGPAPAHITYTANTDAGKHTRRLSATGSSLPVQPSEISATRVAGKVRISWNDVGRPGQEPTHWEISRGPDAEHLTPLATSTSPVFDDPDLSDGMRTYSVRGINAAGAGPAQSAVVDATFRAPFAAVGATVSKVTLTMTPGAGLAAGDGAKYRLYRGSSASNLVAIGDTTASTLSAPAPPTGVHAFFAVAAINGPRVSPRSAVQDVVGPSTQLVTAGEGGMRVTGTSSARGYTLVGDTAFHDEAAVSPNGTLVAYPEISYSSAEGSDLVVRRVDGTGSTTRLITSTQDDIYGLGWSPDGRRLAFTRYFAEGQVERICTVAATGGSITCLNLVDYSNPSWLDANTLVAQDNRSAAAPLVKITLSGAVTPIPNTTAGYQPSVSPDRTRVAYVVRNGSVEGYEGLMVLALSPPNSGPLHLNAPTSVYLSTPSWTRDGKLLYFAGFGPSQQDVFRTRTDGFEQPVNVTQDSEVQLSASVSTPDVSAPTGLKMGAVPAVSLSTSITPTFTATDALNGVSYILSHRKAAYSSGFGAYTVVNTARPVAVPLTRGYTHCFTVRAVDRVGNTSAATPEQCTAVPLDDRSLTRSTAFAAITGTGYYAGTAVRATAVGATVTRTGVASPRQLSVVATTCPTCGTVDVLFNGVRVGRLNLAASTTTYKRVLTLPAFTARSGTVVVKVTSSGKPVVIDGLSMRK
jgi:hypothetical protein